MAHSHSHSHPPADDNGRRLLLAFGITAVFMIIEVVGGLLSGSLALLADAGHMLTDAAALLFALLAVGFARKPPSGRHTFGWLRLTTLAAFLNAIALVVITILIVWEAFQRFRHPQPVAGVTMMAIAVAGLIANLLSFWILHRGSAEKTLMCAPRPSRAWRSAGFRRGDCRRPGDPVDGLDACGPHSFGAGILSGATQRMAAVTGKRERVAGRRTAGAGHQCPETPSAPGYPGSA